MFFRALFTTSLHEDERTDILIRDVSVEAMQHVIEYAYTRNTQVDSDNVEMLLRTADYFNIEGMLKDCCNFLMSEVGPRNCFGINKFAKYVRNFITYIAYFRGQNKCTIYNATEYESTNIHSIVLNICVLNSVTEAMQPNIPASNT